MTGAEIRGWKKAATVELRKIGGILEAEASKAPGWAIRREGVVKERERRRRARMTGSGLQEPKVKGAAMAKAEWWMLDSRAPLEVVRMVWTETSLRTT